MSRTVPRRAVAVAVAAFLALAVAVPVEAEGQADPVAARAFEVRHKPLPDAADLIGELLSDSGSLTLKPRLGLIVVEDRTSVLERVATLLSSFDLPPRSVEVTLSLYLGSRRTEDSDAARPERGIVDLPPLHFTEWSDYRSLGNRSVRGTEGDEIVAELSDDYRVIFVIAWVNDRSVKFQRVTLEQVRRDAGGAASVRSIYSMGVTVAAGRQTFVGTATDPDAPQALFLAVRADPR